jgi:hypothetical protein
MLVSGFAVMVCSHVCPVLRVPGLFARVLYLFCVSVLSLLGVTTETDDFTSTCPQSEQPH